MENENNENKLSIFNNGNFGSVRAMLIDDEPWFVGKDVAEALGYAAERNAIAAHVDDEDKLTHQISASGQMRNVIFINESGLYSLVLSSKLPSAKLLKQNGVEIGGRRLFEKLREGGYLIKSGSSKNMPTQRAMDMGLFVIKEGSYINGQGVNVTTKTTKVTGKGQLYFINKFLSGDLKKAE